MDISAWLQVSPDGSSKLQLTVLTFFLSFFFFFFFCFVPLIQQLQQQTFFDYFAICPSPPPLHKYTTPATIPVASNDEGGQTDHDHPTHQRLESAHLLCELAVSSWRSQQTFPCQHRTMPAPCAPMLASTQTTDFHPGVKPTDRLQTGRGPKKTSCLISFGCFAIADVVFRLLWFRQYTALQIPHL